jgi:hypothetical protein
MSIINNEVREHVARIIERAWPCYIHYADPRELVGEEEQTRWVLTELHSLIPTSECPLPNTVPPAGQIIEAMVCGHQSTPGCVELAKALTRCVPALTAAVIDGSCRLADDEDELTIRSGLADLHHLLHRLDPIGDDDTPLLEALCIRRDRPIEVRQDWRYMVRLTQDDVMGGPLGALDYMPMRCFDELDHARNWAVLLAIWECLLLEKDVAENLDDPRHTAIVAEIERHDGKDRQWRLPFTHVTLRVTRRPDHGAAAAAGTPAS